MSLRHLSLQLLLSTACAAEPAIRWQAGEANAVTVEVAGLSEGTLRILEREIAATGSGQTFTLAVYTVPAGASGINLPAMTGTWRVEDGRLKFKPRFPLSPGLRYRAEFWRGPAATPLVSVFELPAENVTPTTVVSEIYPTARKLPENQLKFYVQFSAPMSGGAVYRHIHVRDAGGKEIELPFIELDEELWNPAMTRLTLLIDPGRIKRGVKPLVDIGPVFEEGKKYSLEIDADWRDAKGRPLKSAHRKEIQVGPADRTAPDPARWKITPPADGTRGPLVVEFDEPMDFALSLRLIGVADANGEEVEGNTTLGEMDRKWTFTPATDWVRDAYKLVISSTIEDLAGNNIGKLFDVDVSENVARKISTTSVKVPFEVK